MKMKKSKLKKRTTQHTTHTQTHTVEEVRRQVKLVVTTFRLLSSTSKRGSESESERQSL